MLLETKTKQQTGEGKNPTPSVAVFSFLLPKPNGKQAEEGLITGWSSWATRYVGLRFSGTQQII